MYLNIVEWEDIHVPVTMVHEASYQVTDDIQLCVSPPLQVGLSESDEVIVLERVSSEWWWVEVDGAFGYVPSNHLSEKNPLEKVEDQWQDDEYFSSYSSLV